MAEKMTDKQDQILASLFESPAIEDNGFSDRLVRRIRRRVWIERLALPVAAVIGAAVAINPLLDVLAFLPSLADILPHPVALPVRDLVPDTQMIVIGAVILVAGLGLGQLVDD